MDNTQEIESPEVFNKELLEAIAGSEDGHLKKASAAASKMVRRRIRENGFSRLILPYKQISDSDLNQMVDTELPVIIEEMEPFSPGAKSISFNDSADTEFYRGDKFVVYFSKISTPEFSKNVDELRTYRMDLRQIITDNALKDVQTEEDARFIKTIDRIVGTENTADGDAGVVQNFKIVDAASSGHITRANYVDVLSHLEDRNLNNGCFLMNRKTAKDFLRLGRDVIGGDLAQSLLEDGLVALQKAQVFGVKHLFTIKRDLVPDGVVYEFAEPGYLGKAYILQDVTMYVEKKKDILRFSALEKIGITIANTAAVGRTRYAAS